MNVTIIFDRDEDDYSIIVKIFERYYDNTVLVRIDRSIKL